jgi:hypothetical protein
MAETRIFSISNDIILGGVNTTQLLQDIIDDVTIVTAVDLIKTKGDVLTIVFNTPLTAPEVTALDGDISNPAGGLIGNHDPTTLPSFDLNAVERVVVPANPTVNDDGEKYSPGTIWINSATDEVFILTDNSIGAANWTNPSLNQPFAISCGRNQATINTQWLRDGNGTPFNLAPYIVPFDIKLIGITATLNTAGTVDFEVFTGANARAPAPTNGSEVAQLSLSAVNSGSALLNVDITSGTQLGIYARVPGAAVNYIRTSLFMIRRT